MKISVEWFKDQFNFSLTGSGAEPFLTVKGCRIVNGKNGEFLSLPSKKLDTGKYWNHVYASEAFGAAVIAEAKKAMPRSQVAPSRGQSEDTSDIPF